MQTGGNAGSSRQQRLDPFALPVEFSARDAGADGQTRNIELQRERVSLRRCVRGMQIKLRVPVAHFRGVAMFVDAAAGSVRIVLEHADPLLSVELFSAPNGDDVAATWRSWGKVLGLPLLVGNADGSLHSPFPRIGQVAIGEPGLRRRRRSAIRARRPAFLTRRKPGQTGEMPMHGGEAEIIARD